MQYKIITISREFGSGGRFIGERLANELQIDFYDRIITEKTAEGLEISEKIVQSLGEYAPAASIFSYAFVGRDIKGAALNDKIHMYQEGIIKELADKGPCVIVGRSSDYILSDRDDVLNVFIEGDTPDKTKRIKELYSVSDLHVKKMLKDVDKKRAANYRYYTDKEWGNRRNYDIMLNSSTLGYDKCIELIKNIYLS